MQFARWQLFYHHKQRGVFFITVFGSNQLSDRYLQYVGYERLYLEGNAQKAVTRLTNQFPQWETRFSDFMWEVSGDHRIYQRQQTKINNKYWAWDFGRDADEDKMVFVPTTRNASVTVDFKNYGIANLDCNGKFVYDTNGKATPDVQWKYAFVEADYPYNIVEYKYIRNVDGKMIQAFDENSSPIYRYPTGEHAIPDHDFSKKVSFSFIIYWNR